MDEVVPERVTQLREALEMSQAALGSLVGTSQASIQRLEAGETRRSRNLLGLARALKTCPEYLVGQTDDPSPGKFALLHEVVPFGRPPEAADPDDVMLDEIDLRYGLGGTYVDGPVSSEKRKFSRAWLRQFTAAPPEHLFWATGDGDSMEPTIRSGEVILIDRSQLTPRMGDGIWAIAWGEIGMIKRLRPLPDGTLEIHSDNQAIRPAFASDGEVHIIGRVIAVVRKL